MVFDLGFYKEYFCLVWTSLRKRKLRSWLTMLGIFIGIAAVVSLISLGQGLQDYIDEQFKLLGADKVMIFPRAGLGAPGLGGEEVLTTSDLEQIKKTRGVTQVSSLLTTYAAVDFGEEQTYQFVSGMPTGEDRKLIEEMFNYYIEEGRPLKKGDRNKAVVGINYFVGDIFSKPVNLRNKLEISSQEIKIVGRMERIGNPADDGGILIPIDTFREIFDVPKRVDYIIAKISPSLDPSLAVDDIEKTLRKYHNLKEGEENFVVQTVKELLSTYSTILNVVNAIVVGIAAISLIVGGIGIMNTMYTAVLERTQEIGIMKAIGARNKDIFLLFFIESGFLGFVGGLIGLVLGIGFSKLIEYGAQLGGYVFLQAVFPWYLLVGALVFSFLVGSISGTLPAYQASKLKPVDALRKH